MRTSVMVTGADRDVVAVVAAVAAVTISARELEGKWREREGEGSNEEGGRSVCPLVLRGVCLFVVSRAWATSAQMNL